MAPLVREFLKHTDFFNTKICVTAQHRQMLDQVLDFFQLKPDYDLDIMEPNQTLHSLTAKIIVNLKPVLDEFQPDYVFVHGDTTTTLASSISSFYSGAKVCHIEAGLRTNNKYSPFPEEINRSVTGRISDYNFAPTNSSKINLLRENINEASILVTGNTVIDALNESVKLIKNKRFESIEKLKCWLTFENDFILVTGHRRENHGEGFENICAALDQIASHGIKIVYPVHLNPNVQKPVYKYLKDNPNIYLIDPQAYEAFIWLMEKSKLIITDSGGIQEEAPSLGKPVLVMRDTTERPEAVDAGTVILVGTDKDKIVKEALDLWNNKERYESMSKLDNPYGDGKASERIVSFMRNIP
ncbi:UDP-N-acetylglucosamine 2-epimerase [Sporocytophaga myxococcoides]|uniref:UDP-N-acetylglucosamine 2-epimerase (non-hydrolyzing) n=2 Tax=Sporocytophaga myxococcoides TaxID=153721 RepID=A0A098LHX2_9BACT|nr:UDP-N-acetylglucosamine 2-epimerase [Sporocytophaga myxococcoides]